MRRRWRRRWRSRRKRRRRDRGRRESDAPLPFLPVAEGIDLGDNDGIAEGCQEGGGDHGDEEPERGGESDGDGGDEGGEEGEGDVVGKHDGGVTQGEADALVGLLEPHGEGEELKKEPNGEQEPHNEREDGAGGVEDARAVEEGGVAKDKDGGEIENTPLPAGEKESFEGLPEFGEAGKVAAGHTVGDEEEGGGSGGAGDNEELGDEPREVDEEEVKALVPVVAEGAADDGEGSIHGTLAFRLGHLDTRFGRGTIRSGVPPSSRGLGHRPFKPAAGVRIPLGAPASPRQRQSHSMLR
jgi:hypothetical protein